MEYSRFVGKTLGQYKLEAPLGKGGMASVYRAYQASMDRYVAIKVMTPEIADDPNFVERFQREARTIGRLEHPHILPVIDFGVSDGIYYIVMRYMDGGSLDDRLRQRRLRVDEIVHYLDQIASALDYAHQRGVIHRDLKPNNVLLDRANNCYLTDFGIARIEGTERKLTATGSVMGTPAYMSPEQAMGRSVDGRSDIYALGVMLYEMVTGRLPFTADTTAALIFQHVYELPPSARQFAPELPEAIDALFNRALAKTPEARHNTAQELADHFAQVVGIRSAPAKAQQPANDKTVIGEAIAPPTTILQPSAAAREAPSDAAARADGRSWLAFGKRHGDRRRAAEARRACRAARHFGDRVARDRRRRIFLDRSERAHCANSDRTDSARRSEQHQHCRRACHRRASHSDRALRHANANFD
jgi:serine/threonine protein kinase